VHHRDDEIAACCLKALQNISKVLGTSDLVQQQLTQQLQVVDQLQAESEQARREHESKLSDANKQIKTLQGALKEAKAALTDEMRASKQAKVVATTHDRKRDREEAITLELTRARYGAS
jgi:exosome complex RNA-binding protein Rrp4